MARSAELEICDVRDAKLAASSLTLPSGVVHVWQRQLSATAEELEEWYGLLSSEEREKSARYRVERPRCDFILTRSTARSLIGRYLGRAPRDLSFRYTEFGKPFLEDSAGLRFNVSHTEGLAVMAFSKDHEVGIDVEKVRPQDDVKKLAKRFFSAHEVRAMQDLTGDELHCAFFRCWTRKEAYIKAKGEGLSLPLHEFDVSIEPNEMHALLATRPDASEASHWLLRDMPVSAGYVAAIAVGIESRSRT